MSIHAPTDPAAGPPRPATGGVGRVLRWLFALLLAGALGGAAYGGYWYAERRFEAARAAMMQDADAYRRDLERRVAELSERVAKAEQAAASAGLLVPGAGGQVPLARRLNELDALREDVGRGRAELEQKLQELRQNVTEALARQQREADASLGALLARQNRLLQAQGHATRALVDLAAGNWGLAREDLRPIPGLLQPPAEGGNPAEAGVAGEAAAPGQEAVRALVRLVDEARVALAGESTSAPELVRLVWTRISELIAAARAGGR